MTTVTLPLFRRGKVREMYEVDEQRLLMVASDRVSAFDVVMRETIPGKGAVLTALSAFWFRRTSALVPNHLLADQAAGPVSASAERSETDVQDLPEAVRDVLPALDGRWLLVRRAARVDVECVVRGYLSGSAWAEYRRSGTVAGEPLPPGLVESERLEWPIFTPATKAESGHDENISRARLADLVGAPLAAQLEELSLRLYAHGFDHALSRGLI